MISEPDYEALRSYKRDRAVQTWSFAVSIPLTLAFWIFLTWRFVLHLTGIGDHQKPEQITEIVHTTVDVQRHEDATPERHAAAATRQPVTRPQPQAAARQEPIPHPQAQPTEIARISPQAPPVPRYAHQRTEAASLAEQLAQQQAAFSRETQQLNASHSTVSVATADPNAHDNETTVFKSDFASNQVLAGRGNGYIYPLRPFQSNGLHCYYGRYEWIYPTGGSEVANIPWPFCFDPHDDPFLRRRYEIPFPLPQPGYKLPPGTELESIEKMVYDAWVAQGGGG